MFPILTQILEKLMVLSYNPLACSENMSPEQKEGPKFGVSTATFLNEVDPRHLKVVLGRPDLSEVKDTITVAETLGDLGLEIVYRKRAKYELTKLLAEKTDLVFTVHTPIWEGLAEAFSQGLQEENRFSGPIKDVVASFLLLGTLDKDFAEAHTLALQHQAKIIVHPGGAKALVEKNYLLPAGWRPMEICIEPDSRRKDRTKPWIWQKEQILQIARDFNFAIAMDLSHTIIAQNNLDLRSTYEFLNDGLVERVKVIHLNAAIPNPETGIPDPADRGLPIITNEKVLGVIKEFYQQLVRDKFKGYLIFEYFQRRGKNLEEKIRILDKSREELVGKAKNQSISAPKQPTSRGL